jgi:hypothetical protein
MIKKVIIKTAAGSSISRATVPGWLRCVLRVAGAACSAGTAGVTVEVVTTQFSSQAE